MRRCAGAVRRAGELLIDADLGGGIIKQRIARKGGGRSAGRTGVLRARVCRERTGQPAAQETFGLRSLANEYLGLDAASLVTAQATGTIVEVECDDRAA